MTSLINFLNNSFYSPQDHMGSKDPATTLMENEIILKMIRNNLKMILKYFCINLLFLFLISLIVFLYLKSNVVVYAITLEEYKTQIREDVFSHHFFLDDGYLKLMFKSDSLVHNITEDFSTLHVNSENKKKIEEVISYCSFGIFYDFTLFNLDEVEILPNITVEKNYYSFMDCFYSFFNIFSDFFFNYHINTYEEQDDILKRKISLIAECRNHYLELINKDIQSRKDMKILTIDIINKITIPEFYFRDSKPVNSLSAAIYGCQQQEIVNYALNDNYASFPGPLYLKDLNNGIINYALLFSMDRFDPMLCYKEFLLGNKNIYLTMIFDNGKFPIEQPIDIINYNFGHTVDAPIHELFLNKYSYFIRQIFGPDFNNRVNKDYDQMNLYSFQAFPAFMRLFM